MKNLKSRIFFILFAVFISPFVCAGPESGVVGVTMLRPYTGASGGGGAYIYMTLDSSAFCATEMFVIDTTRAGGKEAYAAALLALAIGKKIRIEVDVCNGWATVVRSIYLIG